MLDFFKRFFVSDESTYDESKSYFHLVNRILLLEQKLKDLEVERSNDLYELENRLQSQIDSVHPVVYNIQQTDNVQI